MAILLIHLIHSELNAVRETSAPGVHKILTGAGRQCLAVVLVAAADVVVAADADNKRKEYGWKRVNQTCT
jgi:hypothetical protein